MADPRKAESDAAFARQAALLASQRARENLAQTFGVGPNERIQTAITSAIDRNKEIGEARTVDEVNRANAEMVRRARQLEQQGFEEAAARGAFSPTAAQAYRATEYSVLPAERISPQERQRLAEETRRFEEQMLNKNLPGYMTDEEMFYATTPPSVIRDMPLPPPTYTLDELGRPQAMTAEQIQRVLALQEMMMDKRVEAELDAPLSALQQAPPPVVARKPNA